MYTDGTVVRWKMLVVKGSRAVAIVVVVVNPSRAMCLRASCRELHDGYSGGLLHGC
jgi:hypothetical protein